MPGWFRRGSNQGACISQGGDTVKRSLWAYNEVPLSLEMEMSCLPRPPPPFFQVWIHDHKLETTFQPQVKTQQFIECLGLQEWQTSHKKAICQAMLTGICTSLPLVRPTKVLFAWNTFRGICCAARWGKMFFSWNRGFSPFFEHFSIMAICWIYPPGCQSSPGILHF